MREDGKSHGLFRRSRQAKFVRETQPQSELSEFAGQHGHKREVLRSSSGKNYLPKVLISCGARALHHEAPHGICNRLRRERRSRRHHILFSALPALMQKVRYKLPPKFLAPGGLGRLPLEEVSLQDVVNHLLHYFARSCTPPPAIEALF